MRELIVMWRKPRLILLSLVVTVAYAGLLIPFKNVILIPGWATIRPANFVPIVSGLLFGPAGAWGALFGNLAGDYFGGTLNVVSPFGALANFTGAYLVYHLWGNLGSISSGEQPDLSSAEQFLEYSVVVVASASAMAAILGWGMEVADIFPFSVFATIVFFNYVISGIILGPPVLHVGHRMAAARGLLYAQVLKDRTPSEQPYSWRERAAYGILAVSVLWLAVGIGYSVLVDGAPIISSLSTQISGLGGSLFQRAFGVVAFVILMLLSPIAGSRLGSLDWTESLPVADQHHSQSVTGAWFVSGIGLLLAILFLAELLLGEKLVEVSFELQAVQLIFGLGLPIGLILGGVWLMRRNIPIALEWRIFLWSLGGLSGLTLLLTSWRFYFPELLIGADRSVQTMLINAQAGAIFGFIVGIYDAQAKQRTRKLVNARQQITRERDVKEAIRDLLIQESTQSELEAAFCNSVLGENRVLAWIGGESSSGEFSIRSSATNSDRLHEDTEYLGTTTIGERTLREGSKIVENNLETIDEGASDALDARVRSGIAIPLDYNDFNYGVFCVFASEPDAFGDSEQALLEDTAESLAFSVHTAVQRDSLRSDRPMRVVLDIHDEANYLSRLANEVVPSGGSIEVIEARQGENASSVQLLRPANIDIETIREAISSFDDVQARATMNDERQMMQVQVAKQSVQSRIVEYGGAIRSTTVSNGRVRIVSEFSPKADLEAILDQLQEHFPRTELVSRVYVDQSDELRPPRFSELTEKQLNALRTAYASGFFHRPQQATANEIAEILGVSRTTFLQHLRAAEMIVFEEMFEE